MFPLTLLRIVTRLEPRPVYAAIAWVSAWRMVSIARGGDARMRARLGGDTDEVRNLPMLRRLMLVLTLIVLVLTSLAANAVA